MMALSAVNYTVSQGTGNDGGNMAWCSRHEGSMIGRSSWVDRVQVFLVAVAAGLVCAARK